MNGPDEMVDLLPVSTSSLEQGEPQGAICLHCKEFGPRLAVEDFTPPWLPTSGDDLEISLQFVCAGCCREWEWSYSDGIYTFVREVQLEI